LTERNFCVTKNHVQTGGNTKRLFFTLLITIIAFTGITACGGNGGGDDSGKGSVIIKTKAVEKDPMKSMMFSMDYSDLPYAGAPIYKTILGTNRLGNVSGKRCRFCLL